MLSARAASGSQKTGQGLLTDRNDDRKVKSDVLITKDGFVAPHGGRLVDRKVPAEERQERLGEAAELPKVPLGPRALSDLEMISTGSSAHWRAL